MINSALLKNNLLQDFEKETLASSLKRKTESDHLVDKCRVLELMNIINEMSQRDETQKQIILQISTDLDQAR